VGIEYLRDIDVMTSSKSVQVYVDGGTYNTILAGENLSNATVVGVSGSTTVEWQYTTTEGSPKGISLGYEKVRRLTDGSYIATGYSGDNAFLTKLTSLGDHSWSEPHSCTSSCRAYDIQQTSDGGYIITGAFDDDLGILKTTSLGIEDWRQTFDWDGQYDVGYSVVQTPANDGYVVVGRASEGSTNYKIFYIRTDSAGNVDIP
jgi:hypothetical protein